jgi:hypothetical protein
LKANSYREYHLLDKVPPCIPHLQLLVDDIVEVEKTEDRLQNGIINFRRHRHIGRKVRVVQLHQLTPYNLKELPQMKAVRFVQKTRHLLAI